MASCEGPVGAQPKLGRTRLVTSSDLARRSDSLALRITSLARRALLADNYFLAPALGELKVVTRDQPCPYATDGRCLFVGSQVVVAEFSRTRRPPVHDLAHVLVHCLLLHPLVRNTKELDRDAWSLATDIEAERLARDLCGPRPDERGRALEIVEKTLHSKLGKSFGAEDIYRALVSGEFASQKARWAAAFRVDDPVDWFFFSAAQRRAGSASAKSADDARTHAHEGSSGHSAGASSTLRRPQVDDDVNREVRSRSGAAGSVMTSSGTARERLEARWRKTARGVRLDLQTLSRERGQALGDLTEEMGRELRPRQNLTGFLRQFAVPHEQMHVSPDEFDYVYYAYGLSLYGNMPLIENLEYREEHRVHDFVIVIDTSGSVRGEVVRRFVDEAFGVLSSQGLYCERTCIHVIQCDSAVRSDDKITCAADLERWKSRVVLHGFGGTDFRPAFRYVDELVRKGEFNELVGLLYFTDGQGTYPERPPAYKTAFVFYDTGYRRDEVPPWALQLVLEQGVDDL